MPVWLSFYGQCNVDLYFDKRRGKRGKYDIMCTLIYSNKSGEKLKKYICMLIVRFITQIYIIYNIIYYYNARTYIYYFYPNIICELPPGVIFFIPPFLRPDILCVKSLSFLLLSPVFLLESSQ